MTNLILDEDIFDRVLRLPGTAGARLVEMFLEKSMPQKLAAMDAALKAGELKLVEDVAHMIIASAGMLGAVEMQRLAEKIQSAVVEGRDAEIPPLVAEIVAAYQRVSPLVEARRSPEARTP